MAEPILSAADKMKQEAQVTDRAYQLLQKASDDRAAKLAKGDKAVPALPGWDHFLAQAQKAATPAPSDTAASTK